MAAKYAEDDNHVTDVFACTKSLYAATKFDDANVGHDPDEDFLKNLGKMRHSKATLKTSQVCITLWIVLVSATTNYRPLFLRNFIPDVLSWVNTNNQMTTG